MYWINFLHIYQPSDQTKEILEKVTNESYRPLFEKLLKLDNIKINLNINGALTELLFRNGYSDVIDNIKKLADTGRLEFTESAKYHAFLPYIKEEYIVSQIKENHKTNKKYFGKSYNPKCFFPPEMAHNKLVRKVISQLNYPYILIDELSYNGKIPHNYWNKIYPILNTNTTAIFRHRRISNCIMSGIVRNRTNFEDVLGNIGKDTYICTAMDGETFGHHRPGLDDALCKILESKKVEQIFFSEADKIKKGKEIIPLDSTWASTENDLKEGVHFYSWNNPKNQVHQKQWKFLNYILSLKKNSSKIQKALASDQFFWSSGEPWWSIEMIEKGAFSMLEALKSIGGNIDKGEEMYKDILSTAFWWQRNGKIEQKSRKYKEQVKIPFKTRTLEDNKPEVYNAFIDLMKREMKSGAKNQNYEKAILWRDAIYKLENKQDIYDSVHAIDLLRKEIDDKTITKLMDKYKVKYNRLKSGQPEQRKI